MTNSSARKIAIFYTDHDDEWTGTHGNFVTMAKTLLDETKDHPADISYDVFHVCNGEFPSAELLRSVDESGARHYVGIFITGSRYDSFDTTTPWIVQFRELLAELLSHDAEDTYPPIVGICFGHQAIAKTLGCDVGRNPLGFEGGVAKIALNPVGAQLFGTDVLHLSEVHNDVVFHPPTDGGYSNWGSSAKCEVQGLYKPRRLLTFQGHPEFPNAVAARGLEKTRKSQAHEDFVKDSSRIRTPPEELDAMLVSTQEHPNDGKIASNKIWQLFAQRI